MLSTTADYDRYWRETAQFFETAANESGERLEKLRLFGSQIHADLQGQTDKLVSEIQNIIENNDEKQAVKLIISELDAA